MRSSPIITDILGLTKIDQTITCRAFAAVDAGIRCIRSICCLPAKVISMRYFFKDKLAVFLADKSFALVAALEGVRGQIPGPTSFADAQFGYNFELAWWAKFADTH